MTRSSLPDLKPPVGRLRVMSGRDIRAIMERHGFHEVRRRGSHVVMQKRGSEGTVTVPVPDHAEIRIGTLSAIIRQCGIPRAAFEVV